MSTRRTFITLTMGAALVLALMAFGTSSALASDFSGHVYVQTDEPTNHVVVYDRAGDGTLTMTGSFATGGEGGVAAGAVVDPLASQSSLVTAAGGRLLLAVNAGSDSISLFSVTGDGLSLRQVIGSGGDFPVSIAVRGHLVYVLNAGGDGSVRGYRLYEGRLIRIPLSTRTLGLGNGNPPFFLTSPGQVGFTPDGSRLIVTTKASTSSIDVFAVFPSGRLSGQPVATQSATPVPFGFVFDPAGRLVVIEAATSSVSTYLINGDRTLTTLGSAADGQAAGCWIVGARGFFYVSNAGSANLSSFQLGTDGSPALIGVAATTGAGTIDAAASPDEMYLYVESGGTGTVSVFAVHADGTLSPIQTVTGLPIPIEGIATN